MVTNIEAWIDADTGLMWEIKTKENIEYEYVWSKEWIEEWIEEALSPEDLTDDFSYLFKYIDHIDSIQFIKDDIKDAFSYSQKLNKKNYAGFSNWRVPTLEELETLLTEETNNDLYIKYPLSKNTASNVYWSSTTNAYSTGGAWIVYFSNGLQGTYNKAHSYYVRCVRAGQ